MSSMAHLPVHLSGIDECPEPFRDPLRRAIGAGTNIYHIIYSPPLVSGRSSMPGSVFCVTDREWLIVREVRKRGIELNRALYGDTLLVELTDILLYGRLKIVYAFNGQCKSGVCFFNTVSEDMYTNAIYRVLNLMEGVSEPAGEKDRTILTYLESWPLKFRNYGWDFLPPGCCLLEGINWPTILGRFRHELGPGIALLLTDRHLVVVADEPSRSWFVTENHVNVGVIVTFVPRNRISGFHIQKHNRFHILELLVSTAHRGKCFRVRFPPEYHEKIVQLASRAAADGTLSAGKANGESPAQPRPR
jgi:hypothetical protein